MKAIAIINQLNLIADKHDTDTKEMKVLINDEEVSLVPWYDEETNTVTYYTKSFGLTNDKIVC